MPVAVSNINYLSRQKFSMYVCYHQPSQQLLICFVDDVIRHYEHRNSNWREQETATVNFSKKFDHIFQADLHKKMSVFLKSDHSLHQEWNAVPDDGMRKLIRKSKKSISIPKDQERANTLLNNLYEENDDQTISDYFDEFAAVLGHENTNMHIAYMAEINLGLNGELINSERVRKAIDLFQSEIEREEKRFCPASMHYCVGNAWLALKEYSNAKSSYLSVLFSGIESEDILAMCCKNLGATLEHLGKLQAAIKYYELALNYDPKLAEAHFALGRCIYENGGDYHKALEHLDSPFFPHEVQNMAIRGWRIPLLFEIGDLNGAFREINGILGYAGKYDWILPWCARQVREYAIRSAISVNKAISFWAFYLKRIPGDTQAKKAFLLCQWYLHQRQEKTDMNYEGFKCQTIELIEKGSMDSAFLWDRIGHWAQTDDNWQEAEIAFRKAFELEPEGHYGYCLGTALNFLGRNEEALPILLEQAEKHQPDAMSWYQVATAYDVLGNQEKSIEAYNKAIELNPEYDLALFNLGGIYWNKGNPVEAIKVWKNAIQKFPEHELAHKLYQNLPSLFKE